MTYCYECGEKISGDDLFCPFCGISITPIIPVEEEESEDISLDSTIAVSNSELEELKKNNEAENDDAFAYDISAPQISTEEDVPQAETSKASDSEAVTLISTETTKAELQAENIEIKESSEVSDEKQSVSENLEEKNLENLPEEPSEEISFETEIEPEDSELIENFGVVIPEDSPVEEETIDEPEIVEEAENSLSETELSSEDVSKIESDRQIEEEETEAVISEDKKSENTGDLEEIAEPEKELDEISNAVVKPEVTESDEVEPKIEAPDEPLVFDEVDDNKMPTHAYNSGDVQDIAENKVFPDKKLKSILDENSEHELINEIRESKYENESVNNVRESKSEIQQNDTGQRKLQELADKIGIPDSPLEETENRDTRYDSVKIMQDDEPSLPKVSKKTETIEDQEPDSYTTPNIGGKNDTDGKKGLKLKPLEEGIVLNNRYEIIRKIGGGGMGAVYMATDRNLGETLRAVKEMVQSYIEESQQEKAIDDFKREATILSSLDHQAIPTIYDYFYDEREGRFYLVMKYISGGDLSARLRSAPEGRVDEISVAEWAIQIADVLDYLHNLQPPIVYRDLKPANVMLDSNSGRIMLIDFGIARSINKEEKGVTAVGTMGYAPPELFSGNVEARSDIYSLGSTIFHLLTGADPQSNPLLIFDFQKHPRPRQINPSLTDQMEKIIMRSVEYNAQNRFSSAAEMRDELIKHLRNLKAGKVSYGISESPAAAALEDQKVFCGFCGQQIVATDMFCAFCGSKQPLAQQGVHSSDYVSPLMTAKLFVIGTNELEVPAYSLEKDSNILGRRDPITQIFPEVDLSKFDPQTKISRRHARIWRDAGKFMLEDLGSSNGTMVVPVVGESVRLRPHQPHNLINGEKVKVGDTTLHFVIE